MRQHLADVVAIASGKGGVGKSTVAVNLALALRDRGVKVGLVDADLHGPDIPRMLNLTRRADAPHVTLWTNPRRGDARMQPLEVLGLRVMSSQLLMGESQAFAPESGFGGMLLRRFVEGIDWGDAEVLLVDLPPGTGDVLQQVTAIRAIAGVIVVVTPQDVAHLDARKVVSLLRTRGIEILGGVENMASLRCPDCDATIALFPPTSDDRTIWNDGVARLATIPFDEAMGRADRRGVPVVEADPASAPAVEIGLLADAVLRRIR